MRCILSFTSLLALASLLRTGLAQDPHGDNEKKYMGPVAFMWPPDRPWSADADNTPPCGTSSGVGNRTDFPRVNGAIALIVQDESYNISVSVAYGDDSTTTSYFAPQFSREEVEIKPGHICYSLPNVALDARGSVNATIQIKYTSDFFTNKTDTFYACADIRYVEAAQFHAQIPCFNVTTQEFVPANNQTAKTSGAERLGGNTVTLLATLSAFVVGSIVSGLF